MKQRYVMVWLQTPDTVQQRVEKTTLAEALSFMDALPGGVACQWHVTLYEGNGEYMDRVGACSGEEFVTFREVVV